MSDNKPINRSDYKVFIPITTRWMDNDSFGHLNNVVYYSFFDTAVNQFLMREAGRNVHKDIIGFYVVHSNCNYLSSVAYPDEVEVGLRIIKLGNSSVTYEIGVFKKGNDKAAAWGQFVHVCVNKEEDKSVPIPDNLRKVFEKILVTI